MLIVYQSLESTGTKQDETSTFITGNSFKRRVQNSIQERSYFEKSRTWDGTEVVFSTSKLTTPFATESQSKALSESFKKLEEGERNEQALAFLSKIVERIVDNASACTRPHGLVRPYVRAPDIIVLGELYSSSLLNQVLHEYVVIGGIDPTRDARHRFTVLVRTGLDGKRPAEGYADSIEASLSVGEPDSNNKDEQSKCMLVKIRGWLIAFVHTPNSICNDADRAAQYLHNNAQRFGEGAKLDLVMGDTNQASSDTVKSYMNGVYNRTVLKARRTSKKTASTVDTEVVEEMDVIPQDEWNHSITPSGKQVIRGYTNYEVSGTNSNYETHFDIACTREAHVSLSGLTTHDTQEDDLRYDFGPDARSPAFLFHGLTDKFVEWDGSLYAYSDHNGVIVEVLREKPDHHIELQTKRKQAIVKERGSKKQKEETD